MKRKLSREPGKTRLRRILSPRVLSAFLSMLSLTGSPKQSALRLGLDRVRLYHLRDTDKEFGERWNQAIAESQLAMEDEAYRRAVLGYTEPVFQGGVLVGHVQKYSDGLLQFLLKAHNPQKYSEKLQVNSTTTVKHEMDLSQLSEEELANLEKLLTKAAAQPSGD